MAKPNVKALMMEKGEKYLFIGAGALMLLFALMGIVELGAAPDPEAFEKDVLNTAQKVTTTINGSVDPNAIKKLDEDFTRIPQIAAVKLNWAGNLFFDPIAPPERGRINPGVLAVTELQADYLPAKVLSYDLIEDVNGNLVIGTLVGPAKKEDKFDNERANQEAKNLAPRLTGFQPGRGPMGQLPQPKLNAKIDAPPLGAPIESGQRQSVEYVTPDAEKLAGRRYAFTILPQRMVVIQGSFPLKAQMEEIQKALRLDSPADVFDVYKGEEVPLFQGVLIQRQVLNPDGRVETPWTDIDVVTPYRELARRMYSSRQEDVSINYILKSPKNELTVPLPHIIGEKYPNFRMASIKESISRQQALRKPPPPPKASNQFAGDFNPFEPIGPSAGSAIGQPKLEGEQLPGIVKNNLIDKEEGPTASQQKIDEIPDHILIRFIDNDIQPGRLYQYRMKVLMQNPNWIGFEDKKKKVAPNEYKRKEMSRPADAEVMLLGADARNETVIKQRFPFMTADDMRKNLVSDTPWTEMKDSVSVPREEYLFAEDSPVDAKGKPAIPLKIGQGILQIQKWLPVATIDKFKEPVADWIVADIVATRGMYLGGRQLVTLPTWSSQFNRYILRDAPPDKGKSVARHGVFMDPTKPGPTWIVADVEGGTRENKPATRSSTITEDTAAEILLLGEDGRLQVRSSYADRADAGRVERETAWKTWIEKTEKDTDSLLPNTGPKKKDPDFK